VKITDGDMDELEHTDGEDGVKITDGDMAEKLEGIIDCITVRDVNGHELPKAVAFVDTGRSEMEVEITVAGCCQGLPPSAKERCVCM
jgi:hypothetical protein